jgi:trehalose synthase
MLATLRARAQDQAHVRFLVNVEDNDRVVGALMRIARGFIHVSTKEGFGLVVTEAMWQGTPVIGSCVGGITMQVIPDQTGFQVDPLDADAIAARMAWLLDHPEDGQVMGSRARDHVRRSFLLPELVRRELVLLRYHAGLSRELPDFRLDRLSYSEIMHAARPRNPYLSDPSSARLPA